MKETTEQERNQTAHITWRTILGGDILTHDFLRRQANLVILIVILTINSC